MTPYLSRLINTFKCYNWKRIECFLSISNNAHSRKVSPPPTLSMCCVTHSVKWLKYYHFCSLVEINNIVTFDHLDIEFIHLKLTNNRYPRKTTTFAHFSSHTHPIPHTHPPPSLFPTTRTHSAISPTPNIQMEYSTNKMHPPRQEDKHIFS